MASASGKSEKKQQVPPAIIAIVVVLLVAVIGWFGWRSLAPQDKSLPGSGVESELDKWIKEMAVKSGGDMSKLTAEEQSRLQGQTRGFGAMALKTMYEKSKK